MTLILCEIHSTLRKDILKMPARNRSAVFPRVSGGRWFNNNPGVVIGAGPVSTDFADCGDITRIGDNPPFTVNKRSTIGGYINRKNAGSFASSFDNYICDWLRNSSNGPHLSVSGVPNIFALANNAAARTNPSRPYVDVPANVFDMRAHVTDIRDDFNDIMDQIRRRNWFGRPRRARQGEGLSNLGGAHLEYQFLIAPVVGDIVKMCNAQDQINRRIQEINRLYDHNGLRRTVSQGTYSAQSTNSATVQSAGILINRDFRVNTTVECRTHIRWAPQSRSGLRPPPNVIRAWARQAVQGMTIDFSTLWEITPWSWLIDWFGDVGTYLKATRNIIPARLLGVHPMLHTKTTWSCPSTTINNGTFSGIESVRETKTRHTSFLGPSAHFNFLNGSQMGILAALAASRSR